MSTEFGNKLKPVWRRHVVMDANVPWQLYDCQVSLDGLGLQKPHKRCKTHYNWICALSSSIIMMHQCSSSSSRRGSSSSSSSSSSTLKFVKMCHLIFDHNSRVSFAKLTLQCFNVIPAKCRNTLFDVRLRQTWSCLYLCCCRAPFHQAVDSNTAHCKQIIQKPALSRNYVQTKRYPFFCSFITN